MPAPALSKKGLRRSEFAFIDFAIPRLAVRLPCRAAAGRVGSRPAHPRLQRGISAVATHLAGPIPKSRPRQLRRSFSARNWEALSENANVGLENLKRPLPQARIHGESKVQSLKCSSCSSTSISRRRCRRSSPSQPLDYRSLPGRMGDGAYLGQPDSICLRQAAAQRLTLVTYDRRTIPPLLESLGRARPRAWRHHFVDEKTIRPPISVALSAPWPPRSQIPEMDLDQPRHFPDALALDLFFAFLGGH